MATSVQTIERTSKRWKIYQVVGSGSIFIGLYVGAYSDGLLGVFLGIGMVITGLGCLAISRVGAWWENG